MGPMQVLRELDRCLSVALERGIRPEGLVFPVDGCNLGDGELVAICERLERAFAMINEAYRFAEKLADGELQMQVSRKNVFAMPLKALQASLRHLTWQANEVARGDLCQEVHFLGDFSRAFNHMIVSLRQKAVLEERLRTITNAVGEGIYLVDEEGRLVLMNPECERLLGYRTDELMGKPLHEFIHRQQPDGTYFHPACSPLIAAIRSGASYDDDDVVFTCKSGLLMPVSVTCRPVQAEGTLSGAVVAFRDITELKKYHESLNRINELLEKQATTDALTGVYNRLKLTKLLKVELARAHRYGVPLGVVLLDIDHFKSINDSFGHLEGDAVLRGIAQLVVPSLRTTDIFARWGGEEFMIVAPGCDAEHAFRLADKVREKIAQHAFPIPRMVTASFGVASYRTGDTELSLTNRADAALYLAKQRGRNRVVSQEGLP